MVRQRQKKSNHTHDTVCCSLYHSLLSTRQISTHNRSPSFEEEPPPSTTCNTLRVLSESRNLQGLRSHHCMGSSHLRYVRSGHLKWQSSIHITGSAAAHMTVRRDTTCQHTPILNYHSNKDHSPPSTTCKTLRVLYRSRNLQGLQSYHGMGSSHLRCARSGNLKWRSSIHIIGSAAAYMTVCCQHDMSAHTNPELPFQ